MAATIRKYKNLIGGEWVDAAQQGTREIINPATEEVIAEVPEGSRTDVARAVAAAENAFKTWSETTPAVRSEALLRMASAIEEHAEEFAELESRNVGKPYAQALLEISDWSVDNTRFFAAATRCITGLPAAEYVSGYTSMIRREPFGVVSRIVPWNYPLLTAILGIAPAIGAGNVVVVKPDEKTPLTLLLLAELLQEHLPPGVLNVVTGTGEEVGAGIVEHPGIRLVSLVGDVETGKKVAAAAAPSLKRVHLELGGKAPVLVFKDADLEEAARAVQFAGFFNCGQECMAATRVLAQDEVYDEFVAALASRVEKVRVGDPAQDGEIDIGPLISEEQRQRVQGFLERAVGAGASVVIGGEVPDRTGFFMQPAVITGAGQKSEIIQREVFGPVVTVQPFSEEREAIQLANDVKYGLVASVWTENVRRALRVVRELQFGTVWVNDHLILPSEMPIGGYGESGYGKDLSVYSVEGYTQIKQVSMRFH